MLLRPAYTYPDQVDALLRQQGYAVLSPGGVAQWSGCALEDLATLVASWNNLPPDQHLKDGGRYRRRRHASFVIDDDVVTQAPHRAHWQPLEYNALHGGMQRWFDPVEPQVAQAAPWRCLLKAMAKTASAMRTSQPWYLEAHQFRIDTAGGIGRPTPEGAHRDGVDLVAVFLVGREGIKGGETRVFQSDGPAGQRFTLTEPWSLLLLDDARVVHETTPIQPAEVAGHRDTLVLTCRAGSFQDE